MWIVFNLSRTLGAIMSRAAASVGSSRRRLLILFTLLNTVPVALLGLVVWMDLATDMRLVVFLAAILPAKAAEEVVKPLRMALLNQAIQSGDFRATIISMSTALGGILALPMSVLIYITIRAASDAVSASIGALAVLAMLSCLLTVPAYAAVRGGAGGK